MRKALFCLSVILVLLINFSLTTMPSDLEKAAQAYIVLEDVTPEPVPASAPTPETVPTSTPTPAPVPETLEGKLAQCVIYKQDSPLTYLKGTWSLIDPKNAKAVPLSKEGKLAIPVKPFVDAFGAKLTYDGPNQKATIVYQDKTIIITANSRELYVNGVSSTMNWSPQFIQGRLYIHLSAIAKAMGLSILADNSGLIIVSPIEALFSNSDDRALLDSLNKHYNDKPIEFKSIPLKISTGTKNVNVIILDPKDPRIILSVDIPDRKLNVTRAFDKLVAEKNAFAAVNANFFSSYDPSKNPIGNVLINGRMIYGQSGVTTVGISKNKDVIFGNVYTFYIGSADGKSENRALGNGQTEYNQWVAYEINSLGQNPSNVIIYTPERGSQVAITSDGYVAVVENGTVTKNKFVTKGAWVGIPANGYTVYFGKDEAERWKGHLAMAVGRKVDYKYIIRDSSNPDFKWEDMEYAMASGPDLILNGKIQPESTHPMFAGEKFKSIAAPRTAIGMTKEGKLLLVNVGSAKISELKEIMNVLSAYNAINLDGGGSTGMYYDSKVVYKPGRELVTLFYVHYIK